MKIFPRTRKVAVSHVSRSSVSGSESANLRTVDARMPIGSMRDRGGAVLVDQRAGREPIEGERLGERAGLALGDRLGVDPPGARRALEPAGSPAAVDE